MLTLNKITITVLLLLFSIQVQASLVLQVTRVIFPDNKKTISIQATNYSEQATLIQSWVDEGDLNSTPETTTAPFIVIPPIKKIVANNGIQLHIRFIGQELPNDRESVFYLNVLDIAPKPQIAKDINTLQLALQTRIKIFYRPSGLIDKTEIIFNKVKFYSEKGLFIIDNPTPYFINIADIHATNNSTEHIARSLMISPFSTQSLITSQDIIKGMPITVVYINDSGNQISHQTRL